MHRFCSLAFFSRPPDRCRMPKLAYTTFMLLKCVSFTSMRYLVLCLSFAVLSGGCKKKEQQLPTVSNPVFTGERSFSGWINGVPFNASSLDGGCTMYGTRRSMSFQGWMKSTDQIVYITINNFKKVPGEFDLGIADTNVINSATAFYEKDHEHTYYAKKGQVKIVNVLPGLIQGTYSFVTADNYTCYGSFSFMPYYCD